MTRAWLAWGWVGIVGCAGAAPQAPAAATKAAPSAPLENAAFAERASFGDAALPSTVMWLRAANPSRDVPALEQVLGLSGALDFDGLIAQRLGPALASAVDTSKPLDALGSSFGTTPSVLVAYGVADPASFAAQVEQDVVLTRIGPARWRVDSSNPDAPVNPCCELWSAPPPVGTRLLCGTSPELAGEQGAILMAPQRAAFDRASVHVELPSAVLSEAMDRGKRERALAKAKANAANESERRGSDMGQAWVDGLLADLDGLALDVSLDDHSIEIAQQLRFRKAESPFAIALAARSGALSSVPDGFWRLPSDSSFSLYSEGTEPGAARAAAAATAHHLMADVMSDEEVPPAELSRMEQALTSLAFRGRAWELAYGEDLSRSAAALEEAHEKLATRGSKVANSDPALKLAQAKLARWAVAGLEDEPQAYLASVRKLVSLANEDKHFPKRKGAKITPPSATSVELSLVPLRAGAKLPAGTLHVVLSSRPNPKYVVPRDGSELAPAPSTFHWLIAAGEGSQVWVAVARDESLATQRLQAVLAPDPTRTLARDFELLQLAKSPVSGLGYATLAAFVTFHLNADSATAVNESRARLSTLWSLPKKGEARIPLWITRQSGAGDARTITYHSRLQPDAVADLVQLLLRSSDD